MRVTIKQIAEVAGVSRGTVDRALNGRPGVKAEVEENIKRIAKELGYKPNFAAKALADNRYTKRKMGILLNSEGNPYFDEVIRGAQDASANLEQFGMETVFRTMKGYDEHKQIALLDEMVEQGVNGIVLTPINTQEIVERINTLKERGIEIVTVNTDVIGSARLAYVGCKYKKSGTVAAGLIGMMNDGSPETFAVVESTRKNLAVASRVQGIQDTLRQDYPWIQVTDILENEDREEISYEVVSALLERKQDLSGICFAGAGCEGGIRAIKDQKRKMKIVTFDLTEGIKKYLQEGVVTATICQEPYKQGYDGVDILGKYLIWNQKPQKEINNTELTIMTKYSI